MPGVHGCLLRKDSSQEKRQTVLAKSDELMPREGKEEGQLGEPLGVGH